MAKRAKILAESLVAEGRFRLTRTRSKSRRQTARGARSITKSIVTRARRPCCSTIPRAGWRCWSSSFASGAYLCEGALASIEACAACSTATNRKLASCAKRSRRRACESKSARHAFDAFTSPGATTEKIACFVAPYRAADRVGPGGGVDADEALSKSSKSRSTRPWR